MDCSSSETLFLLIVQFGRSVYGIPQLVPRDSVPYFDQTMRSRFLPFVLCLTLIGLLSAPAFAKPPKQRDIADAINANPILTKFAAMVQASDLGTFLSSRGPFTVFVPTDSAFARLPPGILDELLRPENKVRLQDILLFHVVNGKRLSNKDILLLKTLPSCQGSPLTFKTGRLGTQFVMKAKIISTDIKCQNGVINEIDTVLMPPESVLPPIAAPPAAAVVAITNIPPANQDAVFPPTPLPPHTSIPAGATNAPPLAPVAETNVTPVVPVAPPAETNAPPAAPVTAPAAATNAP
jgi:uncharacterized surface protein with fasciclin (FAS1) repeats